MQEPSRIETLSIVETVPRQTPRSDFGAVVSRVLGSAAAHTGSFFRGVVGSLPVLSAAVSSTQSVSGLASASAPRAFSSSGSALAGMPLVGGGLEAILQRLESGAELSGGEYLVLQRAIQQESQQYTAVSNILKVRSDSAKAAINNIR